MPQRAPQFDNGIKKVQIDNRPSSQERGYDSRWQKYSKWFIGKNPLCVICLKNGITTPSKHTDHIIPFRGNKQLKWDKNNHQALCEKCHNRKTVLEDGGFGYKKKPETEGEKVLRLAMESNY